MGLLVCQEHDTGRKLGQCHSGCGRGYPLPKADGMCSSPAALHGHSASKWQGPCTEAYSSSWRHLVVVPHGGWGRPCETRLLPRPADLISPNLLNFKTFCQLVKASPDSVHLLCASQSIRLCPYVLFIVLWQRSDRAGKLAGRIQSQLCMAHGPRAITRLIVQGKSCSSALADLPMHTCRPISWI